MEEHLLNLHPAWCDTLVQWGLDVQRTLGNRDVSTASPNRAPLPPKGSILPYGGHDEKSNGDLDPLIAGCGAGSDVNYDSNIGSSADPSGASEGGPGPASSLCITRGDDGPAPADEGSDDVCNKYRVSLMVPGTGHVTAVRCFTVA